MLKTNNHKRIIIFSFLVLILLSLSTYLGYQNWTLRNQIKTLQSSTPASAPDETVNWREYKTNTHNYSFRYPDGWQISLDKQAPNEIVNLHSNSCNISIYSGSAKTAIPPQVNVEHTKTMIPVGDSLFTRATYNIDDLSVEFLKSTKPSRIN